MGKLDFSTDLPFNLIQVLRLVHALTEAGGHLHVPRDAAPKFIQLKKIFGLKYSIDDGTVPTLAGLAVDHMKPETRVGWITRPLIFPLAAFSYCRSRWPQIRRTRACFPGLPTPSRRKAINEWLALSNLRLRIPEDFGSSDGVAARLSHKVARKLGAAPRTHLSSDGVRIVFSDEGRVFPRKAWNEDYYSWLLESEFVLCPDGDFGQYGVEWTYRFFESVLCGAIPVVQNRCPAYDGFIFRSMMEPLGTLQWSQSDAEHNFAFALERLTVPYNVLHAELARLMSDARVCQDAQLAPAMAPAG